MTELAPYQPTAGTLITPAAENAAALIAGSLSLLDGSYRLAQTLVQTSFAPPHFRGKAEEGAIAIMYGAQLGMDPLQSFQNITVISGRPGLYARTMHALVLQAGHRVTVIETGPDRVVVSGQRKGSPDIETAEWTTERARRAGYTSNKKYETEPEAMLRARALADVCRIIAPDVLLGLAYTAEELEFIEEPADVTPLPKQGRRESAADLLPQTPQGASPSGTTQGVAAPGAVEVDGPGAVTPETPRPADTPKAAPAAERPLMGSGPDSATARQVTAINVALKARGIGTKGTVDEMRVEKLAWLSEATGRRIESSKDLTKQEASDLMDVFAAEDAAVTEPDPFPNDTPPAS